MGIGAAPAADAALPEHSAPRWRRMLELMWATATLDYRRRYTETALGLFWAILEPVLYSLVLYLIFTRVLRFGGKIDHYVAMLMLNFILFRGFREGAQNAMRSMVQKKAMLTSVRMPKLVVVLSAILSAMLLMFTALPVGFGWIIGDGVDVRAAWLLFPVLLLYLVLVTVVVGCVLAALFSRWRDTALVWGLYARILFLSSGVIFPFELIRGEVFKAIISFNPLAPLFVQARVWMIDSEAPTWPEAAGTTLNALAPFLVLVGLALLALVVFRPFTRRAAEMV